MCTYIAIINSIVIASAVLQERFGYDEVQAGFFFTLPYLVAAVTAPPVGFFVSKVGHRMTVTVVGSMLMIIAHAMQLFIPDCDDRCWYSVVPYIFLGLSYSTYAVVLWGSIPYMVEARTLGTAFGICTVFQNLGTVIAPPVMGYIQDSTVDNPYGTYFYVEIFFTIVSTAAFCLNLWVYAWDKKNRSALLQSMAPLEEFEKYTSLKMTAVQVS